MKRARLAVVRVVCASTRPDLIPVVARWHWEEWGHHDPTGSVEAWSRSLAERCHPDRVPATYLALRDDDAAGSASLVEHDMSTRSGTVTIMRLDVTPAAGER